MGATHFTGPVVSGDLQAGETYGPNQGLSVLTQFVALTQNGTNSVSGTLYIPAGAQIVDFNIDVLTVWNSGTSATLSIGTAAAGTQYVSGVDVKTAAGRIAPTYTAAQLAAMSGVTVTGTVAATVPTVVVTVTPVGTAATTGYVEVTMIYVQQ